MAREVAGGTDIEAVAGGLAGTLNAERTELLYSPNLGGWQGRPFVDTIAHELDAPVYLDNDGAVVGLGEAHDGAGKGAGIMGYITVSTGVGGSRIVDGKVDRRTHSFEPGHQVMNATEAVGGADMATLEDLVSGTALELRFGKKAYEVTDPTLWDEELPAILAYGLYNVSLLWAPDVIVLGGSMMTGDPAISVSATQDKLDTLLSVYSATPTLRKAELEDIGGIHGAAVFVRTQLEGTTAS